MTPGFDPSAYIGPYAGLVIALAVVGFLSKIVLDYIAYLKRSVDIVLANDREQTDAIKRLAEAIEADMREREIQARIQAAK